MLAREVAMARKLIPRLILLSVTLFGFFPDLRAERLPIKTYTTADGLPRDHINRIVQDSRGFLWFCTSEGLSRFDGYKFANYGTEQGLPGREVNDFLETRSGVYWVATNKGLARFNPDPGAAANTTGRREPAQRFVVYRLGEEPNAQNISVIYEDHAGTIWCGTYAGLFRLYQANGAWVFSFVDVMQPASLENEKMPRSITEDRRHSLWIGAESGLYRLNPDSTVERFTAAEGLPERGNGRAVLEDRQGRMWVGTASGLLELVADPIPHRSVVERVYTDKDGLSDNNVNSLFQSSDGNLWVGTGMGLSQLLPAGKTGGPRFQRYTSANGLGDAAPTTIAEDDHRNLWIGTGYGAMRLAANGFKSYYQNDGLGGIEIASIFDDQAGDLCVLSNSKHLNRFDGVRFTAAQLTLPKGEAYWGWGWYQTMFQDSHREWWMNTGDGLVRYPKLENIQQITRARPKAIYTTRDGLPANEIFRLFEDSKGDIWISTLGNSQGVLTRWDRATESFHVYSPADGIPQAAPTAFCEDNAGNLWIGFYQGELLRYSGGRFTPMTSRNGLPAGFIHALYLDHAGGLWVATGEGGVARSDNPNAEQPTFGVYSSAQGLSSDQANCITEDEWGMIYIGTGRGLDKLDPATGHIKHYSTADGLPNSFISVAFRQRDGSLWFGTLQGLSRFIPQPESPTAPPAVLVNTLRIAGNPYPLSELGVTEIAGLVLGPDQNHLEIDFAGLNLAVGESLRYQYKLDGAFADWSAPTDRRSVSYPNLPAGTYRFLVRAVSSDGTLSTSPASVAFRVLPPVWRRWWFVLLAIVLTAIPVAAVLRYRQQSTRAEQEAKEALQRNREERLQALEQVRRRIATDLHDDIGSSLSQINLLSEVVRQRVGRDAANVAEPLLLISNASNEMVSSMSDIVWAINPQRDHLSDLIHRMRRFASDTLATRDIEFQFQAPDSAVDIKLGANLRREVFLIFKESINNLVKHSGCTQADISFQLSDNSLWLKVSDNGRGFDAGQESDGHGLGSLRERARSIGGRLDLVSGVSQGTTVSLSVLLTSADLNTGSGGDGAG
jgi:ligand-binding sensor domain-containing protein/signal transduction histidine kinase